MKIQAIEFIALLLIPPFLFACLRGPLTEVNAQSPLPRQKSYEFINGNWFDGKSFRHRNFWSVNGALTSSHRVKVDQTIDLKNGFVIPPFAEGHNHWLEPQAVDEYIQNYLRD
ncbi:MAG TPA: hypothetical protein VGO43_07005, partial [Pyrinomonadaceae bacterium]|nr:hypothetical protein [Pyrinomonadaceae bacterium]